MNKEKNIPKLRFSEFTGEWEIKKLGEIGKFIGGGTPSTQNYNFWNGNIPWISSSDLSEESIYQINTTRFITSEAVSQSATKIIPKQSILIVSRVGVGKIAVNEDEICTSQDFTNLIVNFDNYKFLAYLIKFKTNKLLELNQGTSIKGFVKSDLEVLQIELPSFTEQTKIASFLTSVDEKLQALKKKKSLLEQYKKGVMQQIFSQEIRFKDDIGNEFPNWEEKKLGEVCENIVSGKTKPELEGDYSVYGSTGIIGNSTSFTHNGKFILIARVGANAGCINIVNGKFSVTDNTLIINTKSLIDIDFLYYILLKFSLNKLVFGSGQPLITGGQLKALNIYIPCSSEQTKIANFLSAIDEKINNCSRQIERMELWKKGLLQQMFV